MSLVIVEKKLGIAPDYQYRALRRGWWPQANWHRNKLLAIYWAVKFTRASRVLDLGTGSGNLELELAGQVKEIVGVDYNDEALDFLKARLSEKRITNVKLRQADIRELDRQRDMEKFDVATMVDVIEHVSKPDGEKLARNLCKLLKPGGSVCIITPNYKPLWIALETLLDKVSAVPKLAGEQHLAKYDPGLLERVFEAAGFKTAKMTTLNTVSWLLPGRKLSEAICKRELEAGWGWGNLVLGVFTKPKKPSRRS